MEIEVNSTKVRLKVVLFSLRVINAWNALAETTVASASITIFRNRLELESLNKFLIIIKGKKRRLLGATR